MRNKYKTEYKNDKKGGLICHCKIMTGMTSRLYHINKICSQIIYFFMIEASKCKKVAYKHSENVY